MPLRFPERIALAILLMGVLLLAASCQPEQSVSPTPVLPPDVPVDQVLPSPAPAIHVSLWWNEEIAHRDMSLVQEMGFRWIKQTFAWRDIETHKKGHYNWWRTDRIVNDTEERDLKLIVRLDRQPFWAQADGGVEHLENAPPANMEDFGDFCYAVASRYSGRIHGYQIWNEPNLAREWGEQPPDPEQYVMMLKTCYEGIKRGDPAALVISAGMAPTGTGLPIALPDDEYIRRIYAAGGGEYFDVLGVNAPGFAAPPETSPEQAASTAEYGRYRWAAFRHVEDIRSLMIEMGDGHKQIAILEMGWTTDPNNPAYSWFRVTEEQQADYLVRAYWWAYNHWRPWIGLMTTIYIPDPYWTEEDEQYWWSISLPDWPETKTRPAYDALSTLPDWGSQMPEVSP